MCWHVTHTVTRRASRNTPDTRLPACPQVLLLGCGDIRNALVTAAALRRQLLHGTAPGHATSGIDSKQEIQIHLNDISDCILARDVLLLVRCYMRTAPAQQPPCAVSTWMWRPAVAQHMALLRSLLGRSLAPPLLTSLLFHSAPRAAPCLRRAPPTMACCAALPCADGAVSCRQSRPA